MDTTNPTRLALPRCEYWEPANNEAGGYECGEPAVAIWTLDGKIRVCEEHDRKIEAEIEEDG